jgi:hypothetical protein
MVPFGLTLLPKRNNRQKGILPNATSHLTLEIVFGETRYDLARKRTDSPFAFLEQIWGYAGRLSPADIFLVLGQKRLFAL